MDVAAAAELQVAAEPDLTIALGALPIPVVGVGRRPWLLLPVADSFPQRQGKAGTEPSSDMSTYWDRSR